MRNKSKNRIGYKSKPCIILCFFLFFNVFISFSQSDPNVAISITDDTQRFSVYGEQEADDLGESVSNLGDVNGDGIDDIVIGAPGIDNGTVLGVGEAYVVFGATGIASLSIDINNLDGSNGFTVSGLLEEDNLGGSVSSAGDINNDGINDILIGSSGKAIIIFGSTSGFSALYTATDIDGINGIILDGSGDFGEAVSHLDDVNGDGVSDVIIGAPSNIANAYVFYGSPTIGHTDAASLDGSNGFKIEGFSQSSSGYDFRVSHAGDINNDGVEDIVLGFPAYNEGTMSYSGRVVVIFGNSTGFSSVFSVSSLNGTNGFVLTDDVEYGRFGMTVNNAKDFNGDGIDDLAITATESAYVIFGKNTAFSAIVDISDIAATDKFVFKSGWYQYTDQLSGIDGLSDINNDGITDLIVSVPHWYGYARSGSVYVIYGSTSLPATLESGDIIGVNGYHIFDDVRYSHKGFGASVSHAGDFNNDGIPDFIVGERMNNSDIYNKIGATHVFFGNTFDVIDSEVPTITCPSGTQELYANSVLPNYLICLSSVSDNSTYNTDMVYTQTPAAGTLFTSSTNVEITVTDKSGHTSSCSFMVNLKTTTVEIDCATTNFSAKNLNGTNGLVIYGEDSHSYTGHDVNTAGDVNGDGIDDFIVLAKGDTVNHTGPYSGYHADIFGGVYIIFGTNSGFPPNIDLEYLNGSDGFKINNDNLPHIRTSSDNNFEKADTAGDINNDGYDDIILSNPFRDSGFGHVFVVFGKASGFTPDFDLATLNGTNGFTIVGTGTNGYAGIDIDNLGDVNGDNIDDIILTNGTYTGHSDSGKCFVIYGSTSGFSTLFNLSSLDGTNGFIITTDGTTAENIGRSVSGIGDVNGDDINDMAIGGSKDRKFVVYGKPSSASFPSTFNVEDIDGTNGFAIEHSESSIGSTVSNANDVNNDGLNDIIFGNKYVLFGSSAFPAVFDLETLDGANGFFTSGTGKVFNAAGDFNNDGYDDLIYGDYSSQYLIYGRENWEESVSTSTSPGCLLKMTLFNSNSLVSGSYAGDVNNDGIDDLVLGHYNPYSHSYKVNADPGFAYAIFGKETPDTEDPVIDCPANQILASGEVLPDYTALASVTDNCDSCIVITQSPVEGSEYIVGMTVTLTATDKNGNSVDCSFTVSEDSDSVDPTASNPTPINVSCSGDVPTEDITVVTDEADDSGEIPTVAFVGDVSDGNSNPEVITRTYSVTDEAGNSINVEQTITVNDTENPIASNPSPINVSCSSDVPSADIAVVTDASDNCTTTPTVAFVSDVESVSGTIIRTYSVTDEAGNSINVEQTITVNDTENPTASNPSPINVSCAGDIPSEDISVVTDASDNCTTTPIVAFESDLESTPGTIIRTYSVTDEAGNSINVEQIITVNDTENPQIVCPLDITQTVDSGSPTAVVTFTSPVGADNCAVDTTTQIAGLPSGSAFPIGTTTVTFEVNDVSGNSTTCSFNVIVEEEVSVDCSLTDTESPTASNPSSINVSCSGDIPSEDISVVIDAADNCTTTPIVAFVSDVESTPGIIIRTYNVSDEAGNSINVEQTITVNDTIKPEIVCPSDITQTVDSGSSTAVVTFTSPVGTDNCAVDTTTQIAGLPSGSAFPIGTTIVTFEVNDVSGNSATCSFNVIVEEEVS
ncbi:HYR domain-containing protein, partial [Tamlana sp. 2_MG-2023]|uniref:HYR domain-containing protein n=1 Tax=unclassified Tamlana TaxID=2614803 RepID=UPI0026E4092F